MASKPMLVRPTWRGVQEELGLFQGRRYSDQRLSDLIKRSRKEYKRQLNEWMHLQNSGQGSPGTGGAGASGGGVGGAGGAGGGYGGAGGYGGILSQVMNDAKAQQAAANAANEARYAQLLAGNDALLKANQGMYAGLGQEQMAQIDRDAANTNMQQHKNVVARGLGSSTISGSMRRGVNREATQQKNLVRERIGEKKIGDFTNISQAKQGIIERRTDEGPDMNALYQMAMMYGQGQGGQGGSRGGGGGSFGPAGGYPASRYAKRSGGSGSTLFSRHSTKPFGYKQNYYSSGGPGNPNTGKAPKTRTPVSPAVRQARIANYAKHNAALFGGGQKIMYGGKNIYNRGGGTPTIRSSRGGPSRMLML